MQIFSNNAQATLAAEASGTTLSLVLDDASRFSSPVSPQFQLATLLGAGPPEIVKITARVGNTLTVVRAQEGTVAQVWPVGTAVVGALTAGTVANLPLAVTSISPTTTALGSNAINIQKGRSLATQVASGLDSIAIGKNTSASGEASVAFGDAATALSLNSVAIGSDAYATTDGTVAVGKGASANSSGGAAFGSGATVQGYGSGGWSTRSISLGDLAMVSSNSGWAVVLGASATINAGCTLSTALGGYSSIGASSQRAVALGAYASVGASANYGIAVGASANATAAESVAVGRSALASGSVGVALGSYAIASANYGIAVGASANATAAESVAVGRSALASGSVGVALGSYAIASAGGAIALGGRARASYSMSLAGYARRDHTLSLGVVPTIGKTNWDIDGEIRHTTSTTCVSTTECFDLGTGVPWSASAVYKTGDVVVPTTPNGFQYVLFGYPNDEISRTYQTGLTEPVWPTIVYDSVTEDDVANVGGSLDWIAVDLAAGTGMTIPDRVTFYADEVGFVCFNYANVTTPPVVSIGTSTNPTALVNGATLSDITGAGQRHRITNPANVGITGDLFFRLDTPAGGTNSQFHGRFYVKGFYISTQD